MVCTSPKILDFKKLNGETRTILLILRWVEDMDKDLNLGFGAI